MTGREYLRVSAKGERSIPELRDDNFRTAEREGVTFRRPYQDEGSASRYARTNRDEFDRLTDDLKNGQFGADLLCLWESSRGSRRVGEWVTLIELCEEQRVRVYVTAHGRFYDPADPRDRRSLLEDAVDSEYESAKISKRTLRGMDATHATASRTASAPWVTGSDRRRRRLRPAGSAEVPACPVCANSCGVACTPGREAPSAPWRAAPGAVRRRSSPG
jgi:DNA invertase Pin-like site-specific DNA recombinase